MPESVLLRREKCNAFGSIEDLPDEELADPEELERINLTEEFWPILRLPVRGRKCPIKPSMDEDGRVNWGAFGTADFDEYRPDIDKALYKANLLLKEHRYVIWTVEMLKERIEKAGNYKAKCKVIKYVRMGIIEVDDINDWDTWQLAKYCMRALRLKNQIEKLREKRRRSKQEKLEALWRSMGC